MIPVPHDAPLTRRRDVRFPTETRRTSLRHENRRGTAVRSNKPIKLIPFAQGFASFGPLSKVRDYRLQNLSVRLPALTLETAHGYAPAGNNNGMAMTGSTSNTITREEG